MHSDGLGRLATASERIRLVIINIKPQFRLKLNYTTRCCQFAKPHGINGRLNRLVLCTGGMLQSQIWMTSSGMFISTLGAMNVITSVLSLFSFRILAAIHNMMSLMHTSIPVAYPGGFSGCPEIPPPAPRFFSKSGGETVTDTNHLNLRLLETPPDATSGYATFHELDGTDYPSCHNSAYHMHRNAP